MKHLYSLITISFCLTLASCSTSYRVPEITNYQSSKTNIWTNRRYGMFTSTQMINPQRYTAPGETDSFYHLAHHSTNEAEAEMARNALQTTLIELSDKAVSKHLSQVTGTQIDVNMALGGAALVATGVGAVAAPTLAKAASASGIGILGFKSLFNDEVYRNALVQTLVSAIISDRDKIKADLDAKRLQTIRLYSVDDAIEGISKLQEHGSFYYGLTLIKSDVEKATAARVADASTSNSLPKNATNLYSRMNVFNTLRGLSTNRPVTLPVTNAPSTNAPSQ